MIGTIPFGGTRSSVDRRWVLAVLAIGATACGAGDVPPESVASAVSAAIVTEEAPRARRRPTEFQADYVRARAADEASRRHDVEHPAMLAQPPTALPPTESDRTPRGGIPDARFLTDADLTLGSGFLVADVSFLSRGEPDDYALEPTGHYRVRTTRYRVRAHGFVRRAGLPVPEAEFDLFTNRNFVPSGDGSGEAPRMLVVLGDHSMRPGYNLKMAVPLGSARGPLRSAAFGAATGASSDDVLRDLRVRASSYPSVGGGS